MNNNIIHIMKLVFIMKIIIIIIINNNNIINIMNYKKIYMIMKNQILQILITIGIEELNMVIDIDIFNKTPLSVNNIRHIMGF